MYSNVILIYIYTVSLFFFFFGEGERGGEGWAQCLTYVCTDVLNWVFYHGI